MPPTVAIETVQIHNYIVYRQMPYAGTQTSSIGKYTVLKYPPTVAVETVLLRNIQLKM